MLSAGLPDRATAASPRWRRDGRDRWGLVEIYGDGRSFATDRGALARAPFSARCPVEIENTVTFTAQHDTTVVHLAATPFGASDDELAFFADLCTSGSLAHGYGGTFDQLAAHLAA